MAYDYDKLYAETPDALGPPTPYLAAFLENLGLAGARVLDIGCGQGRDALFLARAGAQVTGVDLSPHGVRDMMAVANAEGLSVEGVVADVAQYQPDGMFDILLIDRTLHMLDEAPRLAALGRFLPHVVPGGWIVIADETSNLAGFEGVLAASGMAWQTEVRARGYLFARRGPAG